MNPYRILAAALIHELFEAFAFGVIFGGGLIEIHPAAVSRSTCEV